MTEQKEGRQSKQNETKATTTPHHSRDGAGNGNILRLTDGIMVERQLYVETFAL